MLLLGVVIGWLAKPAPPAAPPPEPVAAPPPPTEPVVERKTEAAPTLPPERDPGPPPADSPFLADSILATFTERDNEAAYRRAVSFLAQGDAQGGLRGIVRLEAASQGKAWREPALVLVIEARAAVGEVGATRHTARVFQQEFPDSLFRPRVMLAEARTFLIQAERFGGQPNIKNGPERAEKAEASAQELFDRLRAEHADSPEAATAEALSRSIGR